VLTHRQGNKLATTLPRVSTVSPVSPLAVPEGVTLIRSIRYEPKRQLNIPALTTLWILVE
jgi:hypothetical protein